MRSNYYTSGLRFPWAGDQVDQVGREIVTK